MEWVLGLMEIGMINTICLLTGFILNGVVSCKVYKIRKTKKKATSLLLKNPPEKMWKDVSVYCNQGGLWLHILADYGAHPIWLMSCTHVSLCIIWSLRMRLMKIFRSYMLQTHLTLHWGGASLSTTFKLAHPTCKTRKLITLCATIWFNICGMKRVSISIINLGYFLVFFTPTYYFLFPYISHRLFYRVLFYNILYHIYYKTNTYDVCDSALLIIAHNMVSQ